MSQYVVQQSSIWQLFPVCVCVLTQVLISIVPPSSVGHSDCTATTAFVNAVLHLPAGTCALSAYPASPVLQHCGCCTVCCPG